MTSSPPVSNVAIIGAGAIGVTCLKFLFAEKAFTKIDVFEQRQTVGGTWNLSYITDRTRHLPIPQEDPWYGARGDKSTIATTNGNTPCKLNQDALEFESPLYDDLEANIPKASMQYSDKPFPDECPLYPDHKEVLDYLERYADDVRDMIQFETQVQDIELLKEGPGPLQAKWKITARNLKNDRVTKSEYDAVIIASGHYDVPRLVGIQGVAEWNKAYPGAIIHSKGYRNPEPFKGHRVLIIGNSASGTDIAFHVGKMASRVFLSSKSASAFWTGAQLDWKEDVDEVVEFLPAEQYHRAIKTKSGRIIEDIDSVVFATGYFYSFPFLSRVEPAVITDGLRVRDTYLDFIHIEHPTLMFPTISNKIVPFQLGDNQAAVVARLWSGRVNLPSKDEMRRWEKAQMDVKGTGKGFHTKAFPEELALINDMYTWSISATPKSGLENNGIGKLGTPWDPPRVWLRSRFIDLKMAYIAKGSERRKVRTPEELGFEYSKWRPHAKPEELEMFKKAKCPARIISGDGEAFVNGVH